MIINPKDVFAFESLQSQLKIKNGKLLAIDDTIPDFSAMPDITEATIVSTKALRRLIEDAQISYILIS